MSTSQKLKNIATKIVIDKATEDRVQDYLKTNKAAQGQQSQDACDGSPANDVAAEGLDDLSHWRERRMQAMKEHKEKHRQMVDKGNGTYELVTEMEFLKVVTSNKLAVAHFFSTHFERCKIMDKHLKALAAAHVETRFFFIDAEKSLFFCGKLGVKTLPTVVLFNDGIAKHSIVGFSEMGNNDEFSTTALAKILMKWKVIERLPYKDVSSGSDESDMGN